MTFTGSSVDVSPAVLDAAERLLRTEMVGRDPSRSDTALTRLTHAVYLTYHRRKPVKSKNDVRLQDVDYSTPDTDAKHSDSLDEDALSEALVESLPVPTVLEAIDSTEAPQICGDDALVRVGGIKIKIRRSNLYQHQHEHEHEHGPWSAELPAARVDLSPGYVLFRSPTSTPNHTNMRLYVGLRSAQTASAVWKSLVTRLLDADIAFTSKCLYLPRHFPASDTIVVYFNSESLHAVETIAQAIAGSTELYSAASVFTRPVAPGCAIAIETPESERQRVSFGQHRAASVARALLLLPHDASRDVIQSALAKEMLASGIDPARPYQQWDQHLGAASVVAQHAELSVN